MASLPEGFQIEKPTATAAMPEGFQLEAENVDPSTSISDIASAAGGLVTEAATGFNRGVTGLLDFLTIDQINNVRSLMGDEAIPTLQEALIPSRGRFTQGTIAEGLPTDIAASSGEMGLNALTGQWLLKQGAKQLAPIASSAAARVLRQVAQPSTATAGALGVASGAGEEIGREAGGETGALVGAIAAPIGAAGIAQGGKALLGKLTERLGANSGLINTDSGLPVPAFEKALSKRGLDFGSVVDDVERLPVIPGKRTPDEVVDFIVRRKLLSGSTDDALAGLKLEGSSIVADELGEEALKQGFKGGQVQAAKSMGSSTKKEALKMLNMNRQILSNASKADEFRPTDVVGKNVMERFNFIRSSADRLNKELDSIAKGAGGSSDRLISSPGSTQGLKGLNVNTQKIEDNVFNELNRLGIEVPVGGDLAKTLSSKGAFTGSDIAKDRTSQRVIKDVVELLGEGGNDALRAHKLKRQLDTMLDFNKKSASGLTDAGKKFAASVRKSLNDSIREVSPQYARVNDELSKSIESMNNLQRVLGPSIDVFDRGASKAVGQDLRGLLSNRKSRIKLDNAIESIDKTARELGGNFDVDVRQLARFSNTLDDRFGAVADTSLKGEMTSAIGQAARGQAGAVDFATRKLAEQAEKMRGINDKNALNVMQRILTR